MNKGYTVLLMEPKEGIIGIDNTEIKDAKGAVL